MAHKKTMPPPKKEIDRIFDVLLGTDEEMDEQSARELLNVFGMNSDELVAEFKQRLSDKAQEIRLHGGDVPLTMQDASRSLRSGSITRKQVTDIDPTTWLDMLLSGRISTFQDVQVQFSFKKRKGEALSGKDEKLLNSLKNEIEDKT